MCASVWKETPTNFFKRIKKASVKNHTFQGMQDRQSSALKSRSYFMLCVLFYSLFYIISASCLLWCLLCDMICMCDVQYNTVQRSNDIWSTIPKHSISNSAWSNWYFTLHKKHIQSLRFSLIFFSLRSAAHREMDFWCFFSEVISNNTTYISTFYILSLLHLVNNDSISQTICITLSIVKEHIAKCICIENVTISSINRNWTYTCRKLLKMIIKENGIDWSFRHA